MRSKLIAAVALAIFAVFGAQGASGPTVLLEMPEQIGKGSLPSFSVRERNGESRVQARQLERMAADPETKRVALIFFATWCVPCAQGATRLKNASAEVRRNGVLPIFINIGEGNVAAINNWVDRYAGPGYTRFIDVRSQMAERFGLLESDGKMVTPKTLVLDKNLKPLFLFGEEGDDFPEILWKYTP